MKFSTTGKEKTFNTGDWIKVTTQTDLTVVLNVLSKLNSGTHDSPQLLSTTWGHVGQFGELTPETLHQ